MLETLNDHTKRGKSTSLIIASFVDDTYLLVTSPSYKNNMYHLARCFREISEWAEKSGVSFEPEKHELLHFARPRSRTHYTRSLKVGDLEIKPKDSMKILGIVVDSRLTWQDQVTGVCSL